MRFRPCIDIHQGIVKQIVGSTLSDSGGLPETNFQTEKPPDWFSSLYRKDNLTGGHIIQLGPGNEQAALKALDAWSGGMQLGGGITIDNAKYWLDAGASAVILTSWIFHDGSVDMDRLKNLMNAIGKNRLVLDLSCRRRGDSYMVVTDRWQTYTNEKITTNLLNRLSNYCDEFLVHGVDVEGKCRGIETPLVALLGKWSGIPITYAGGIQSIQDIELIGSLGMGRIDFTVGSALDIFGGTLLKYREMVEMYGS